MFQSSASKVSSSFGSDPKSNPPKRDLSGNHILVEGSPVVILAARKTSIPPHALLFIQELNGGRVTTFKAEFYPNKSGAPNPVKKITRIIYGEGIIDIDEEYSDVDQQNIKETHEFSSSLITSEQANKLKEVIREADPTKYSVTGELTGSTTTQDTNNCLTFCQGILNKTLGENLGRKIFFTKCFPQTPKAGVRERQKKNDEGRQRCSLF